MPISGVVFDRLAAELRRQDFGAFIRAVERLPVADRNILAVLGAVAVRREDPERLSTSEQIDLAMWDQQFRSSRLREF